MEMDYWSMIEKAYSAVSKTVSMFDEAMEYSIAAGFRLGGCYDSPKIIAKTGDIFTSDKPLNRNSSELDNRLR